MTVIKLLKNLKYFLVLNVPYIYLQMKFKPEKKKNKVRGVCSVSIEMCDCDGVVKRKDGNVIGTKLV